MSNEALPPPIPHDARRLPPPIPLEAQRVGAKKKELQSVDLTRLQETDRVEAFEILGFKALEVQATMEKKDASKIKRIANEDQIIADHETGLLGVCDGVGGGEAGEAASRIASEALPRLYRETASVNARLELDVIIERLSVSQVLKHGSSDDVKPHVQEVARANMQKIAQVDPLMARKALSLLEAVRFANREVATKTPGQTTLCAGFVHTSPNGEHWAVVANIGDSGAFKRGADGSMTELTVEDSLVNYLIKIGYITHERLLQMQTNPKETLPINGQPFTFGDLKRTIISGLGKKDQEVEASLSIRKLRAGEELYFMTDGAIDKFEDPATLTTDLKEMSGALAQGSGVLERLNAFRQTAKQRKTYKRDDDIAVVRARILSE